MSIKLNQIRMDLNRYFVSMDNQSYINKLRVILSIPGIWVTICFRIGSYFQILSKSNSLFKIVYFPFKLVYSALCFFCGIDLSLDTSIGGGLYIGHHGGIVIHTDTIIGENCNISHGVTIGVGGRKGKRGVPSLGNFVYIGPGSVIFGNIEIGSNVAIGANAVVTKSVPDNAVVAGVPAKIISKNGSRDFVAME